MERITKNKNIMGTRVDYERFNKLKDLKDLSTTEMFKTILDFYINHNQEDLRKAFERLYGDIVK